MHNSYRVGFLDLIRSSEDDASSSKKKKSSSDENNLNSALTKTQIKLSRSLLGIVTIAIVRFYSISVSKYIHRQLYHYIPIYTFSYIIIIISLFTLYIYAPIIYTLYARISSSSSPLHTHTLSLSLSLCT
jgi:hypothetical protein